MLFSTFTRARLGLKWVTVVIFGRQLPTSHIHVSIKSKSVSVYLWVTNYFTPCNSSPQDEVWVRLSLYSHGMCSDEMPSLVPSVLIFTVWTRHATHIVPNQLNSLHIPLKMLLHANHCSVELTSKKMFFQSLQS